MVRYVNPGGHDWVRSENFDGYGISLIVVILLYSILFYAACIFLWLQRSNPAIRMRKIPLALLSVLVLHVYLVIIFVVYPLNGHFPCGVEFWVMSIYLPVGIGLFQAQNQQLLIVSREQNLLKGVVELYRPLYPDFGGGLGGPRYWTWRLKLWWRSVNTQNKYEGFVFVGMVVQVRRLSLVKIAKTGRRFPKAKADVLSLSSSFRWSSTAYLANSMAMVWYHIIHHLDSVVKDGNGVYQSLSAPDDWSSKHLGHLQLFGNFYGTSFSVPTCYGRSNQSTTFTIGVCKHTCPLVLGKSPPSADISKLSEKLHRLPGTPLWLAAVYTDSFASVSKYWVPPMW